MNSVDYNTKISKIISHKIVDEVKLRRAIKKTKINCGVRVWSLLLPKIDNIDYYLLRKMCLGDSFEKRYESARNVKTTKDEYTLTKESVELIRNQNHLFYCRLEVDTKILHQIKIDVKRLNTDYVFVNGKDLTYSYYNILILISHMRFKLGYVQGMADLLVPFLSTCPEHEAYFLYLSLIMRIEFNIINLQANLILRLREELENIDPFLYKYLQDLKLDFHVFCFRWFNCLFFREFEYKKYLRVFSFILAHRDIDCILVYIAVSIFEKRNIKKGI